MTGNFIPDLRPLSLPECKHCQEYLARWQGGVALHAKTAEQLALANASGIEKDQEIQALRMGLIEAVASIRALGGKVDPKLRQLAGIQAGKGKVSSLARRRHSKAVLRQDSAGMGEQGCKP
jgi:hypothetical protein